MKKLIYETKIKNPNVDNTSGGLILFGLAAMFLGLLGGLEGAFLGLLVMLLVILQLI